MTDDDGNEGERVAEIIRLFPTEDEHDRDQPASRAHEDHCSHRHVTVTRSSREVDCRDCGRRVDAFDVLDRLAGEWDSAARWHDEANRRSRLAHERLTEILRLETNARARLKRLDPAAAEKAPQRPWGGGSVW